MRRCSPKMYQLLSWSCEVAAAGLTQSQGLPGGRSGFPFEANAVYRGRLQVVFPVIWMYLRLFYFI